MYSLTLPGHVLIVTVQVTGPVQSGVGGWLEPSTEIVVLSGGGWGPVQGYSSRDKNDTVLYCPPAKAKAHKTLTCSGIKYLKTYQGKGF